MGQEADQGIVIRKAQVGDAGGIARVRVDSWRFAYQNIVPQDVLDGLAVEETARLMEASIRRAAPGSCYRVAQDRSGQIVGFALGGPERSNDPLYKGELYAIYLLPAYFRIGIGHRLLLEIADCLHCQGIETMLIWVLADNPARKFYEALGGIYVRSQPIVIGQAELMEVAYGWQDLPALLGKQAGDRTSA